MKYHLFNGIKISELTLGTVQFGLEYSINSVKPNREKSSEILKNSVNRGITSFDTAREYGSSEELIGSFIREYPEVTVITKFKISPHNMSDFDFAMKEVYESVTKSRISLGIKKIPILLFHKGPEHSIEETSKLIPRIMNQLIEEGWIEMGGVSVFEVEEIPFLLESEEIQVLQIPINIMDHRLFRSSIYEKLILKDKIVFARSVFLKGLFFRRPESLKGKMDEAIPYLEALNRLSRKHGMSIAQMAISFVQDLKGVTSIVLGADNVNQIQESINLIQGNELSEELKKEIFEVFTNVPEKVITPRYWGW